MAAGTRLVARAPNHLGDGVLALPALIGLSALGELEIQAPAWGRDLYRDVSAAVIARGPIDQADVAVLFPPSFRVAWQARRARRRIGVAADLRRWLLTDVVPPCEHRADTYAALAKAAGAVVVGTPTYRVRADDPVADVPVGHIGLNPISPSGAVVEWSGYAELASRLDRPVVFYGGPGEDARVEAVAGDHPRRVGLSLPAFAAALGRCAVFVSNDSGGAHFARACGVPTVVVHGSTTAARTGPHGAIAVEGPDLACRPCYRKTCAYGLECLQIPVERVHDAVRTAS
jgi:heptosyltransferase-2